MKKLLIISTLLILVSTVQVLCDTQPSINTKLPIGDTTLYKKLQDTLFNFYSRLGVTARSLFQYNLDLTDELWKQLTQQKEELPYQLALKSLASVPQSAFNPTGVEIVQRQEAIASGMRTVTGLSYSTSGLRVPLDAIGQFLGLTEDVSPEIRYSLDVVSDIEIVVYSSQAKVIATLFKGKQVPGVYQINWNLRDDYGRRMPTGDYIAEVRIGENKYIRKRIVIP